MITVMDKTMQVITSASVNVNMEVEPNSVVHTSPDKLPDTGKRFMSKYPTAREPTDIIAIAASPFTLAFCPRRNRRTAHNAVTGNISRF